MFANSDIDFPLLKKRAFNLRWATVPEGVIPLTAADPDFPCAPEISEAITRFASDRYFSYAPAEGYSFFKEAMANYYSDKRNIPANPAFLFPVDSAAFGIDTVCKAFLNEGDEAIIFDPVDFLFRHAIEANKAVAIPFTVSINPETEIEIEQLEELITSQTKMICLCNPLNPIGKVFTKKELVQIGNIAVKYGLIILSDEIWSDIIFEPSQYISIASLDEAIRKQTVVVTGFSKSHGLAGLRLGVLMASTEKHFQQLLNASGHLSTVHGSNVLAQVAGTSALNECEYWLNDFNLHLKKMRNLSIEGLNAIDGFSCYYPQGCYLAFPDITATGYTSTELQELLLNEAKVAVVPGLKKWFGAGAEGHIRISFATSEEVLKEAILRIQNFIQSSKR